jgi:hypothetical protein
VESRRFHAMGDYQTSAWSSLRERVTIVSLSLRHATAGSRSVVPATAQFGRPDHAVALTFKGFTGSRRCMLV